MAVIEKPGMVELYAVAVNTSDLDGRAMEIVGAMGFARLELARAAKSSAGLIAADIGATLWRARDGKDKAASRLLVESFSAWLCAQHPWAFEVGAVDPGIINRFAGRVIEELLHMQCRSCRGGGTVQVLPGGKRVLPGRAGRGYARACEACRGSGRPRISHVERRRVLGRYDAKAKRWGRYVDREEYDGIWRRAFVEAFIRLRDLGALPRDQLHSAARGIRVRP